MQKDFIDGSLGTEEAQSIVEKVKEKILSYPKDRVYATFDYSVVAEPPIPIK